MASCTITPRSRNHFSGDTYESKAPHTPETVERENPGLGQKKTSPGEKAGPWVRDPILSHKVYDTLLDHLPLLDEHKRHLEGRGLSADDIQRNKYRSFNWRLLARGPMAKLVTTYGDQLASVPAFYKSKEGNWRLPPADGIVIPVRNAEGHIQALQVRQEVDPKYKTLSSRAQKAGSPVHVLHSEDNDPYTIRVVEGYLKADVVAALAPGTTVFGLLGVGSWKKALPLLEEWGPLEIRIAFDSDWKTKPPVRENLEAFGKALSGFGWTEVLVEEWDEKDGKGLDDLLHAKKKPVILPFREALKRYPQEATAVTGDRRRRGLTWAEVDNLPEPEWQVQHHFSKNNLVVMAGPAGVGKSFIALDYSLSLATGTRYLGQYEVKTGPVLYIASEGATGLKTRRDAWLKHHHQTASPANMVIAPHTFNFRDMNQERDALAQIIEEDLKEPPALVVVDTLARNFGGGNDNSSQDMGQFVETCDWLRDKYQTTTLVLHHTGKDATKRERGSTALRGAADTVLLLDETDGGKGCLVQCDKQKDAEPFEKYILKKQKILLGPDRDSLVLVMQGQTKTRYHLLPKYLKSFLQTMWMTVGENPFPTHQAIELTGGKRPTISRYMKTLVEKELLLKFEQMYHLSPEIVRLFTLWPEPDLSVVTEGPANCLTKAPHPKRAVRRRK